MGYPTDESKETLPFPTDHQLQAAVRSLQVPQQILTRHLIVVATRGLHLLGSPSCSSQNMIPPQYIYIYCLLKK